MAKVPAAGFNAHASACSSVVLPAPDGPITATRSPGAIASDSGWSAGAATAAAAGWRAASCASSIRIPGTGAPGLCSVIGCGAAT